MQTALRRSANVLVALAPASRQVTLPMRRLFATQLEHFVSPPTASTSATSSPSAAAGRPSRRGSFVAAAPVDRPKAPRYSRKSSRIVGRRQSKRPRKVLAETGSSEDGEKVLKDEQGQIKIFLPSVFVRLVRNTGPHAGDPYTATFRTDLRLTKPDIANYLRNIYGLEITSIRTMNYLSKLKRNPIGGGYSRTGGTKNYKKVLVTITKPFWYPEERSRDWVNEHFRRDAMEQMRDRKMLKIGDGGKYGVSAQRYRGAHLPQSELERRAGVGIAAASSSGDQTAVRKPFGLKKQKNVIRSRDEQRSLARGKVEQEMDRLRQEGW